MKRVLMVAFHYPPFVGGSGIQRTLKFSNYLPSYGWLPIVLTANPLAYAEVGNDQVHEIPKNVTVTRAFALDAGRHLAIYGSYPSWLALPDRWVSWWLGAVPAGWHLLRKYRPEVIWSTYPIATAHLIGLTLHCLTGVPWVADFRDSMTEEHYPPDGLTRQTYRWIERQAIRRSSRLVFTAHSTREMYLNRYPDLRREQASVILNGYDEEDFKDIVASAPTKENGRRPTRLLHAGIIYPDERDPRPFFRALSRLRKEGRVSIENLRVDLRASGSEDYYAAIIQKLGINDLVHLLPALPHQQALQDCANADGLLVFQAASCNHQIPAKIYEYLRARRPILALTPDEGDTTALLRETGGATVVDLSNEQSIYMALPDFLESVRNGTHPLAETRKVQYYTRRNQALELAECLSEVVKSQGAR